MEVKGFQSFHELLNVLRFPELSRSVRSNVQANRSSGKKTNTYISYTHGSAGFVVLHEFPHVESHADD